MTYAGTHPLNMNRAPSFLSEFRITPIVELDPGPEAFMIRLCVKYKRYSGASTELAELTYFDDVCRRANGRRYCTCSKASGEMAVYVVVEVTGLQELGLEVIIPGLAIIHTIDSQKSGCTYEASWEAFIRTARNTFGTTPRASDDGPSSLTIFYGWS